MMTWIVPYCVVVIGGLIYCLVHDYLAKRREREASRTWFRYHLRHR